MKSIASVHTLVRDFRAIGGSYLVRVKNHDPRITRNIKKDFEVSHEAPRLRENLFVHRRSHCILNLFESSLQHVIFTRNAQTHVAPMFVAVSECASRYGCDTVR